MADTDKPKDDATGLAKVARAYSMSAIFLGAAFLLWGVVLYGYHVSMGFIEQGVEKPGVVVELIKVHIQESGAGEMTRNYTGYSPVVEYTDDFGRRRLYRSDFSSNPASYEIGEAVALLIDPLNSKYIRIKGFSELYAGLWIVGFIASVFTLIGFGVLHLELKWAKPKQGQHQRPKKPAAASNIKTKTNGKPPLDFVLLKNTIAQHLPLFLLLFVLCAMFTCIGGWFIYYSTETSTKLFGCLFMLPGLGVLVFAFVSNVSSISYYYEKGMLKQYGREVLANITEKHVDEFIDRSNCTDSSEEDAVIERDYRVGFCYSFNGTSYNSECFLDKQELYESLEIGQEIPVIVLPYKPDVAHLRIKKLTSWMKLNNLKLIEKPESNVIISESHAE